MPGGSRALPDRPNLRYLRLEAKRRLAAGEFATLHDAQTAIAREHGQPSWAALKRLVQADPDSPASQQEDSQQEDSQQDGQQEDGHALVQIRWVISRFSGADQPGCPPSRTRPSPSSACPPCCWPADRQRTRSRGCSPRAGPTWTGASPWTPARVPRARGAHAPGRAAPGPRSAPGLRPRLAHQPAW
jgi:hypothetical protein